MNRAKVIYGQNMLDVAIQLCGAPEAVFQLAKQNGIDDITAELLPGTEIKADNTIVANKAMVQYFTLQNKTPNTGTNTMPVYDRTFDDTFDETFN